MGLHLYKVNEFLCAGLISTRSMDGKYVSIETGCSTNHNLIYTLYNLNIMNDEMVFIEVR
jgi:hypothetical protein